MDGGRRTLRGGGGSKGDKRQEEGCVVNSRFRDVRGAEGGRRAGRDEKKRRDCG